MIPLNLMPFFWHYWPYMLAAVFFYTVFYLAMERTRVNIDRDAEKRRRMEQQNNAKKKIEEERPQKRREAADNSDTDDEIGDQATPAFEECPFIPYQGETYGEVIHIHTTTIWMIAYFKASLIRLCQIFKQASFLFISVYYQTSKTHRLRR